MAEAVVFTSGNGSNFQAICEAVAETEHKITAMICNKKGVFVRSRCKTRHPGVSRFLSRTEPRRNGS